MRNRQLLGFCAEPFFCSAAGSVTYIASMMKTNLKYLHTLCFLLIALAGTQGFAAEDSGQTPAGKNNRLWRRRPDVTIPFTLIYGIPFIKLSVNGHDDELFVLDSGSQTTTLNSDEAARLNIELTPSFHNMAITINGLGDSAGQKAWISKSTIKLKFGRETVIRGRMLATSIFSDCGLTGVRIAGILGYDVLRLNTTVIDYANSKFMIYQNGSFIPRGDAHIQALSVDKTAVLPVIAAALAVNGKDYGNARVVVDTGSDDAAMLYVRFAASHSINELEGWKTGGKNCAIGGSSVFLHGLPGSAIVGRQQVALPDISVLQNKEGLGQSDLYDALLGSPVLHRWSIVFDIPKGKIYFIDPAANAATESGN